MFYFRKVANRLYRLRSGTIFMFAILFIAVSTTVSYVLEPDTFGHWFNALYWVLTTMATVGYGDYFMKSYAGKAFTILLYLFGIGLLSLVIGKIIDGLSNIKKRREGGKVKFHGNNHIIVIGWNSKVKSAVEEILLSGDKTEIVLIAQTEKDPYDHKRVHFVSGDPATDETLLMANVTEARSAIIFADTSIEDSSLVDGRSLLIASCFERMAPHVHTIVEILMEKHIQSFQHARVNDFILSHDAVSALAVRSAMNEGNIGLYTQLLKRQQGEDIFQVPAAAGWVTYGDAFQGLLAQGATLIADGNDMTINRKLKEPIPANAKLYVICDTATYNQLIGERR